VQLKNIFFLFNKDFGILFIGHNLQYFLHHECLTRNSWCCLRKKLNISYRNSPPAPPLAPNPNPLEEAYDICWQRPNSYTRRSQIANILHWFERANKPFHATVPLMIPVCTTLLQVSKLDKFSKIIKSQIRLLKIVFIILLSFLITLN